MEKSNWQFTFPDCPFAPVGSLSPFVSHIFGTIDPILTCWSPSAYPGCSVGSAKLGEHGVTLLVYLRGHHPFASTFGVPTG